MDNSKAKVGNTNLGTYNWTDEGKRYEGEWKVDKMEGKGKFTWKDKKSYEGHYKDGKKSGHGVMTWTSGVKYVGEWLNGQQNGQGKLYSADGKEIAFGNWRNGSIGEEKPAHAA